MLQIFIAVMHNQKHSTQPPTLSPPQGDQVLFYSQDMDRLSPVSSIENNFYSRPKQELAPVSLNIGDKKQTKCLKNVREGVRFL